MTAKHAGLFGRNEGSLIRVLNYSGVPVQIYFATEDAQYKGAFAAFKDVQLVGTAKPGVALKSLKPQYSGVRAASRYLLGFSEKGMYYISLENANDEFVLYEHGAKGLKALTAVQGGGGAYQGVESNTAGAFWNSTPTNPNVYLRNFSGVPLTYNVGFGRQSGTFLLNSASGFVRFNGIGGDDAGFSQNQTIVPKPASQGIFGDKRQLVLRLLNIQRVVIVDITDGKEDIAIYPNQIISSRTGHVAAVPTAITNAKPVPPPLPPRLKQQSKPMPPPGPPPPSLLNPLPTISNAVSSVLAPSALLAPIAPAAPAYMEPAPPAQKRPLRPTLPPVVPPTVNRTPTVGQLLAPLTAPLAPLLGAPEAPVAPVAPEASMAPPAKAPAAAFNVNDITRLAREREARLNRSSVAVAPPPPAPVPAAAQEPSGLAGLLSVSGQNAALKERLAQRRAVVKDEDDDDDWDDDNEPKNGGQARRHVLSQSQPKLIMVRF